MSPILLAASYLPIVIVSVQGARVLMFDNHLTTYTGAQQLCRQQGGRIIRENDLHALAPFPNRTGDSPFQFWIDRTKFAALDDDDQEWRSRDALPATGAKPASTHHDDSTTDAHDDDRPSKSKSSPSATLEKGGTGTRDNDDSAESSSDAKKDDSVDVDDDDDADLLKSSNRTDGAKHQTKTKPNHATIASGNSTSSERGSTQRAASVPGSPSANTTESDGDQGEGRFKSGTEAESSSEKARKASKPGGNSDIKHKEDIDDEDDDARIASKGSSAPNQRPDAPATGTAITIRKMSEKEHQNKKEIIDAIERQKGRDPDAKVSPPKAAGDGDGDDFIAMKLSAPSPTVKTDAPGPATKPSRAAPPQTNTSSMALPVAKPASGAMAPGVAFPASSVGNAIASGKMSPTTSLLILPAMAPADTPTSASKPSPQKPAGAPAAAPAAAPASAIDEISPDDPTFRPAIAKPSAIGFQTLSADADSQNPSCATYLATMTFSAFCTEVHIPVCIVDSP